MYASGMVVRGRLGDLAGVKIVLFMAGVASFRRRPPTRGGLARSRADLVGARLLQGTLTGAAMVPQVLALITATFPARGAEPGAGLVRCHHGAGLRVRLDPRRSAAAGGRCPALAGARSSWRTCRWARRPGSPRRSRPVDRARGRRRAWPGPGSAWSSATRRPWSWRWPRRLFGHHRGLARLDRWSPWCWPSSSAWGVDAGLGGADSQPAAGGELAARLLPLFRDLASPAGSAVNFALVSSFCSFMFVPTLLLQAGLELSPRRARAWQAGVLALDLHT